jgi:hypothetical protein
MTYFYDDSARHHTLAFRQIYNLPDKIVHGTALELGGTIASKKINRSDTKVSARRLQHTMLTNRTTSVLRKPQGLGICSFGT